MHHFWGFVFWNILRKLFSFLRKIKKQTRSEKKNLHLFFNFSTIFSTIHNKLMPPEYYPGCCCVRLMRVIKYVLGLENLDIFLFLDMYSIILRVDLYQLPCHPLLFVYFSPSHGTNNYRKQQNISSAKTYIWLISPHFFPDQLFFVCVNFFQHCCQKRFWWTTFHFQPLFVWA